MSENRNQGSQNPQGQENQEQTTDRTNQQQQQEQQQKTPVANEQQGTQQSQDRKMRRRKKEHLKVAALTLVHHAPVRRKKVHKPAEAEAKALKKAVTRQTSKAQNKLRATDKRYSSRLFASLKIKAKAGN